MHLFYQVINFRLLFTVEKDLFFILFSHFLLQLSHFNSFCMGLHCEKNLLKIKINFTHKQLKTILDKFCIKISSHVY